MDTVYARCCGLDIHKKTVVACLITPGANGHPHRELRTFRTLTADLLALAQWLTEASCTHVAMESTGVYWKPLFNLLEGSFTLLVVNAQHIKAVPGRKTDVRDAEWIADLLRHGLLAPSFIPPMEQRELRDLTRHRTSLVQDRARVVNRLQKVLEDTNVKLGDVATDILGKSARAMLEALLGGQTDPKLLADLALGRLRSKRAELEQALVGVFKPHHRFLLSELLAQIDTLDEAVDRAGEQIVLHMQTPESEESRDSIPRDELQPPTEAPIPAEPPSPLTWTLAADLLCTIPGIGRRSAEGILAEIGVNMARFPSSGHLASWAGICPGNYESAGKRLSGRIRKGNPWLRLLLVETANAASHTKNTYLSTHFHRVAARRGRKKAMIALGHTLLVVIYHVLQRQHPYTDLGSNYFDERDRHALENRLVRRLEHLGYEVALTPPDSAA